MKIVVLVKEVPDTYQDRELTLETGLLNRAAGDAVLDEVNERGLEVALTYADAYPDTDVVIVTMAPASASTTVRRALALGATSAVHVVDDDLRGADLGLTADVLAAAIRRTGFDLVIAGDASTDGSTGILPAMLAEKLGVALLDSLATITVSDSDVAGTTRGDDETLALRASLPAVVSVTGALPGARVANLKGVMAAKRKPLEVLTAADLGIDATDLSNGRSIMLGVTPRPARAAGTTIVDEGDAGQRLADYLLQNRLA